MYVNTVNHVYINAAVLPCMNVCSSEIAMLHSSLIQT
jgi:hypothetical protein